MKRNGSLVSRIRFLLQILYNEMFYMNKSIFSDFIRIYLIYILNPIKSSQKSLFIFFYSESLILYLQDGTSFLTPAVNDKVG